MPVDLGTLTRVDPGQFGAVGGRDRRADRTVALSYTDVVTQTACWEERSQVCDEIRLTLAEVRRRTPSAEPAWGPRGTTPRLTVRGTAAGAPPPPPPPPIKLDYPPPPLYKLRPCPSYSRRRDHNNCVRNFNCVRNVVRPHETWVCCHICQLHGAMDTCNMPHARQFDFQEFEVVRAQTSP